MTVERFGSKTDVVVKLVLVFFVCLLSFSIGTYVGKKFSDNQHKLAQFEPSAGQERDLASVNPESAEVKPQEALSDDEVAKLAEEFVAEEKSAEAGHEGKPTVDKNAEGAHGKVANAAHEEPIAAPSTHGQTHENAQEHKTEESHGVQNTPKSEPMKAAIKVAHSEDPSTAVQQHQEPSRIPSSLPKGLANSTVGKFTVQVAAYPSEEEAKKMSSELKEKGFSAFFVSAKIKDRKTNTEKIWYRVSVGLFATQKEADLYKADLLARSKVSSALVQKITE